MKFADSMYAKEETSSHTSYLESMILTSVIYTKEDRYVSTIDIPNFFIKTSIYRKPGEKEIIINIKVVLVDILVHMNPEKYFHSVVYEKVNKVLYVELLKAVYRMLKTSSIIIY